MSFFKVFNSLQITGLFAAFPFLVSWLWTAEFTGAPALRWVAIVAYVIFFVCITGAVCKAVIDE